MLASGENAQDLMAPPMRRSWMEAQSKNNLNPREAGVLALVYPNPEKEAMLLFILRRTYSGVHSGQMAFPGGKKESSDQDLWETALRETEEEVGVPRQVVQYLTKLTEVYIPPSNFLVQPYLGWCEEKPPLAKQEEEVEEIIEISVGELFARKSHINTEISTSYANKMEVPAYHVQNQIIWGATAMMLSEIEALFAETE